MSAANQIISVELIIKDLVILRSAKCENKQAGLVILYYVSKHDT